MTVYEAASAYLPHKPPMMLIDKVCEVNQDSVLCESYVCPDGVLAPFLDQYGNLPGWFALELMAQAIGIWSGWHGRVQGSEPKLGMLLGTRALKCGMARFPSCSLLQIYASRILQDERLGSFECVIHLQEQPVVTARLNVYQPGDDELEQVFAV